MKNNHQPYQSSRKSPLNVLSLVLTTLVFLSTFFSVKAGSPGPGNTVTPDFGSVEGGNDVAISGDFSGYSFDSIAVGGIHTLAINDGVVFGWGANSFGQLGDGTTSTKISPTSVNTTGVLNGKTIIEVETGEFHTLALDADGCDGNHERRAH